MNIGIKFKDYFWWHKGQKETYITAIGDLLADFFSKEKGRLMWKRKRKNASVEKIETLEDLYI